MDDISAIYSVTVNHMMLQNCLIMSTVSISTLFAEDSLAKVIPISE